MTNELKKKIKILEDNKVSWRLFNGNQINREFKSKIHNNISKYTFNSLLKVYFNLTKVRSLLEETGLERFYVPYEKDFYLDNEEVFYKIWFIKETFTVPNDYLVRYNKRVLRPNKETQIIPSKKYVNREITKMILNMFLGQVLEIFIIDNFYSLEESSQEVDEKFKIDAFSHLYKEAYTIKLKYNTNSVYNNEDNFKAKIFLRNNYPGYKLYKLFYDFEQKQIKKIEC